MKKIQDMMSLKDKVAFVAGAAGHIGLAACETLMELGAKVCVVDQSQEKCDERCNELNAHGYLHKAVPFKIDLSSEQELRNSIQQIAKKMNGLDILVHCAAFVGTTQFPGWAVPFPEQTLSAWDAALRVNLSSAFVMVQEAASYLKKSGHGSVIFISSMYGMVAPDMSLYEGTNMANPAGYGVSKAGLIQLAKYLATLLAPDIRVNAISPGGVWRNQAEVFHQKYKNKTPLKRMASEEDMKGAIAYLSSDLSSYVTGSNLVIDGGFTIW